MSSTSIHESVAGFHLSLKAESHLTPFRVFDNVGDKDGLLREAQLSFWKRKDEGLTNPLMEFERSLRESVTNCIVNQTGQQMLLYFFAS